MNKYLTFESLFAEPTRNGVYITQDKHGFGTSIVNMGELFAHPFIHNQEMTKVLLSPVEQQTSLLQDGDLLFARRSLVASGAGKVSIVIQPERDITFESSVIRVRLDKNKCYPLFYFYWLNSPEGQATIRTLVTGSNVKGIKSSELSKIQVPSCPIGIQKNIADYLFSIDSKVSINNTISSQLESLARTIYNYWFLQFDFPDENGKPYRSSGGKMVWNEELKREIPEGWEVCKLGDIIQLDRGVSYTSEELASDGIPMINLNSFNSNCTYKPEGLKFLDGEYNRTVKPYDLLICVTQQTAVDLVNDTDVIGKAILVPDIFETSPVISMDVIRIDPGSLLNQYFLLNTFNTKWFHKYISGFATGTKIKHLGLSGLTEFYYIVPPKSILDKYEKIVSPAYQKISEIIAENQQLTSLRDFLLPLLMNGQVTVGE